MVLDHIERLMNDFTHHVVDKVCLSFQEENIDSYYFLLCLQRIFHYMQTINNCNPPKARHKKLDTSSISSINIHERKDSVEQHTQTDVERMESTTQTETPKYIEDACNISVVSHPSMEDIHNMVARGYLCASYTISEGPTWHAEQDTPEEEKIVVQEVQVQEKVEIQDTEVQDTEVEHETEEQEEVQELEVEQQELEVEVEQEVEGFWRRIVKWISKCFS